MVVSDMGQSTLFVLSALDWLATPAHPNLAHFGVSGGINNWIFQAVRSKK